MKKMLKCACCGKSYSKYDGWQELPVNSGSVGLCDYCTITKEYREKNNKLTKTAKKHGFTFGYEIEGRPYSKNYLALCNNINNFIPTKDCSLPVGYIELKSPIYQSLNGLKKTLSTIATYMDCSHDSCGQHIHVGHSQYINEYNMEYIRDYYIALFKPLSDYMDTVNHEAIYGREFNYHYAGKLDRFSSADYRYNFINVTRDNTIEFRLCKLNNVNQYYWLFELSRDIVATLINNFIAYIPDNDNALLEHKAKLTGNKIVKVFQKYYEGQAHCQRPSRNDRKW